MRLIDAEPIERALFRRADKSLAKNPYENAKICAFRRAFELVLDAPTITSLPNDPLTLEELREMDGEPVWVTPLYGRSPMWCFVVVPLDDADKGYARNQTRRFGTVCNGIAGHFKIYGRTWLAYRRRTEEGEK